MPSIFKTLNVLVVLTFFVSGCLPLTSRDGGGGPSEIAKYGLSSRVTFQSSSFPADIDPSALGPDFPTLLSQTGLFKSTGALVTADGLIPYDVRVPFYSDDAKKRRWMGLPGEAKIVFSPTGDWIFPTNTVFIKHFDLMVTPTTFRRLETRVFIRFQTAGWQGFTYRWNVNQTEAELVDEVGDAEDITITDAQGATRTQTWTYPSRGACMGCHSQAAGYILGARTRQLNMNYNYAERLDNQIRSWNHIGLFTTDVGSHLLYPTFPALADMSASVSDRARAYLEVNCSTCHRPGGSCDVMDLRYDTALNQMDIINVAAANSLGNASAVRVTPGDRDTSVLYQIINRSQGFRMPLGISRIDPEGVSRIGAWIDSLE